MEKQLRKSLEEHKELYTQLIFGIDEISEFVPEEEMKQRRFNKFLPFLKEYLDKLEFWNRDENGQGFFGKLFNENQKLEQELVHFRTEHQDKFTQLKSCSHCQCLHCNKTCQMEGCNRCDKTGMVSKCDNKSVAVYTFKNKSLSLTDDASGQILLYNVLAVIQDREYNQFYIILENNDEKNILYFHPGISNDSYEVITDVEDMNFAVEAFESIEK